jgi:rsbT co-antagonist protein RsbR
VLVQVWRTGVQEMGQGNQRIISELLKKILAEWMGEQVASGPGAGRLKDAELREQCRSFLNLLQTTLQRGTTTHIADEEWLGVREMLADVSRSRSLQGFSPSETATFVFSLKQPLFNRLRREIGKDAEALGDEIWRATELLDKLGLFTTEIHQKYREEIINRQQQEMLELSTPVVKLWDGILALPLIGTLDSDRTQVVMETLLQKIVETGAGVAIIDITGVSTVDTLVAQHLIKTVTAARLMGADCIISGIRPQIAQTIVHLGIDLKDISTKASLADALALALKRSGMTVVRAQVAK